MVDWHENLSEGDVFLLSPAVVDGQAGHEFPGDPRGRCVFLTEEGKCSIYPVRPFECAEYIHTDGPEVNDRHDSVAEDWKPHQEQIRELLGREPESSRFTGGFGGLFGNPFGSFFD